ncbi:MAG: NEW3 domain-containing protein [Euryarchaeota archaeon]|nr:NEW3 domain-containing protein [Euryarchaeota archaeon]
MFLKYVAVSVVLCAVMLGYLHFFIEAEHSSELGIEVHFPENTKEISSGDASFIVSIENSGPERDLEFTLGKDLSDGWTANFCFNDLCFLDHATYTLKARENLDVLIGVTPDYDQKEEGRVTFSIKGEEINRKKEFSVKADVEEKKYRYTITGTTEWDVEASKTAEFTLAMKNTGEEDIYTISLEKNLPVGWKASSSEEAFSLERNEERDIKVYITTPLEAEGGDKGSVSLKITPENAEERDITLKTGIKKDYSFRMQCPESKKYVPKGYDATFSIKIINTGNSKDTYHLEAEEGTLSKSDLQLAPGEKGTCNLTVSTVLDDMNFTVTVNSDSGLEESLDLIVQVGNANKGVLAEMFTATWCHYCYKAEEGIEEMTEEYPGDVFYIQYHPGDVMEKPISDERLDYYSFAGYPTVYFNGAHETVGGYEGVAEKYRDSIEEELEEEDMTLMDLSYEDNELTIKITPLHPIMAEYDLYIISYKDISFKGAIYPNVAQDSVKKKISMGDESVITVSINIEEGVVVFIQDRSIIDFEVLELK